MLKNYYFMFMVTLTGGTIMAISASNWFTAWLGLEINMLGMIPLMLTKISNYKSEAAIKYFLVQALASLILIFIAIYKIVLVAHMNTETWDTLIAASLFLKAGIAPLHFWFPQVISNVNWPQAYILFSWQKIAPLTLLSHMNFNLATLAAITSAAAGALGGLNMTHIKPLITYSSIAHSGWLLMAIALDIKAFTIYFSIYATILAALIAMLSNKKNKTLQMNFWNSPNSTKLAITFSLLSLGGLPPFLGFFNKLLILSILSHKNLILPLAMLILSSLLSIYWYLRLVKSSSLFSSSSTKFFVPSVSNPPSIFTVSAITLNILMPLGFTFA